MFLATHGPGQSSAELKDVTCAFTFEGSNGRRDASFAVRSGGARSLVQEARLGKAKMNNSFCPFDLAL